MKRLLVAIIAVGAGLAAGGCSRSERAFPPGSTSAERGAQLVALGACNDCHTPRLPNGQLDMRRELSGEPVGAPMPPAIAGVVTQVGGAFRGPWGLSVASNITADKTRGIGSWTQAQFLKTLRSGVDPSGHTLLPPMPGEQYARLPDADLIAIYNYLMTVQK